MRAYVESNYVLELSLRQEECDFCEQILLAAEGGVVDLRLPAYSLTEPHETLTRRHRERFDLQQRVGGEVRQLARTDEYRVAAQQLDETASLFATSVDDERQRLEEVTTRLISVATVIPLTSDVVRSGYQFQTEFGLSPQDSFVFASVIHDLALESADSLFVTRNPKDFDDPDIKDLLSRYGCRAVWAFEHALSALQSALKKDS